MAAAGRVWIIDHLVHTVFPVSNYRHLEDPGDLKEPGQALCEGLNMVGTSESWARLFVEGNVVEGNVVGT